MKLFLSTIGIGLSLLFMGGCAGNPGIYRDQNMDFGAIHTVAVLPFANLTRDNTSSERVRDVFTTMLMATGGVYALPPGEVARGVIRAGIGNPAAPSVEEAVKLGGILKVDALITGVVREYGEVRSATSVANVSAQPKQTGPQLQCTEIKDAVSCRGWTNCRWMESSGKGKAGCVKAGRK